MNAAPAPGRYLVRCRHTGELVDALVEPAGEGGARVTFGEDRHAVAPGQSVVVYDGPECLGGGVVLPPWAGDGSDKGARP